ncbi:MAG: hypothetical protein B7Y32_01285 [Methylophilales bacterium 16-45-7]|nr:MAG: hypothetical protein B7Y32_01285 [Methylophilales bacterium 16-45-7]
MVPSPGPPSPGPPSPGPPTPGPPTPGPPTMKGLPLLTTLGVPVGIKYGPFLGLVKGLIFVSPSIEGSEIT